MEKADWNCIKKCLQKCMLREVFTEFHHLFKKLDQRYFSGIGAEIELGVGVSPKKFHHR